MTQFKIYQLKNVRDSYYAFMSWDFAKEHEFTLDDYCEVYSGERGYTGMLDYLFEEFNINHPEDFQGHSLSVSDVVALKEAGEWKYYYCDSFGWEEL